MKTAKRTTMTIAAVLLLAPVLVPAQDAKLQDVLQQLDVSSARFQNVHADITSDNYTAVVQDHEIQKGITAFRRAGGSMEMTTILDKGQPSEKELLYKNGQLSYYQPGLKQETIFSAGANKAEYDSLLATGFGSSGKELTAAWDVTFQGMETLDGVTVAKLDLVSKQANIRNNFSHLTIWLDPARDISLKQVMLQPDGDSRTVTYTSIRYNTHLSGDLFTLKVPGGTQIQRR